MASYHLSVKTVKRSAGRSATAAAAYRAGELVHCEREGRVHDYTRKHGVEDAFILAPEDAPDWAHDRQALWNAVEARETRSNSVTAREWELALPAELGAEERRVLVTGFARELVSRYGIAADVAIHAPHREGDQRNWHAHVLTTTRAFTHEGLGEKTRVLDAKATGGPEIELMRARWAELQNHALEQAEHAAGLEAGELQRVDHRSLALQREAALEQGDELKAEELDRAPEVKLGPAVSAIERRAMQEAWYEDRDYVPVTERGARVHEACQERALVVELRRRMELARETYVHAREEGHDRVTAGLAALRAAAKKYAVEKEHGHEQDVGVAHPEHAQGHAVEAGSIRERLARILDRGSYRKEAEVRHEIGPGHGQDDIRDRLGRILRREVEQEHRELQSGASEPDYESQSIHEKLQAVLRREKQVAHEKPDKEHEHGHEQGKPMHWHKERGEEHEL